MDLYFTSPLQKGPNYIWTSLIPRSNGKTVFNAHLSDTCTMYMYWQLRSDCFDDTCIGEIADHHCLNFPFHNNNAFSMSFKWQNIDNVIKYPHYH
jgi:hypothetical protein